MHIVTEATKKCKENICRSINLPYEDAHKNVMRTKIVICIFQMPFITHKCVVTMLSFYTTEKLYNVLHILLSVFRLISSNSLPIIGNKLIGCKFWEI